QVVATASEDTAAKVWEVASGRCLVTLTGHLRAVYSVAFSADGKRLATGSADGTVRLWDVASGQEVLTFKGPGVNRGFFSRQGVTSVAFSPDGKRLACAGGGVILIWNASKSMNQQEKQ